MEFAVRLWLFAAALLSLFTSVAATSAPTASPTAHWFQKGAEENNNTINLAVGTVAAGGVVTCLLVIYCIRKGQKEAAAAKKG